ncbi:sensor histidine kinase [Spirosoma sp.]|uniref:sensor histidine kinase n=1 Tax=Spirosoma sp. TaxID=1899569 RepID=UPI003B3BE762
MHSLSNVSLPLRGRIGQFLARLAPLAILYLLLRNDGPLLGLTERYGTPGQFVTYGQWGIQSAIFYGFGYWLFPRFLYQFRPFALLIILLTTYGLVYVANYVGFIALHETAGFPSGYGPNSAMTQNWKLLVAKGPLGLFVSLPLFIWNFMLSFAYPSLLLAFKALYDNRSSQLQNTRLQYQNTQLELKYLKSQVNPHFLFNVLNSIYALTEEESPRAAQMVQQLSGMMRYALYETAESFVPLQKELQFIRDYVALEKTRAAKRLDLTLELPDNTGEHLQIAPFILITFVENAFKHGVENTSKKSWMRVVAQVDGVILRLEVANSKPATQPVKPGGLGLENVRKRLSFLYPAHKLQITDEPAEFIVRLTIPLSPVQAVGSQMNASL